MPGTSHTLADLSWLPELPDWLVVAAMIAIAAVVIWLLAKFVVWTLRLLLIALVIGALVLAVVWLVA